MEPTFGQMTDHALTRCGQRGIKIEAINFVLANFDCDYHAGTGASAVSISRLRLAELEAEGGPVSVIDQAGRIILIIADDGAIVTAINRPTWFARFHYGADRLGRRRRSRRRHAASRR